MSLAPEIRKYVVCVESVIHDGGPRADPPVRKAVCGAVIANPYAVAAGNVFNDMVRLLGRAGHETGAWDRIAAAAGEARTRVEERFRRAVRARPAQPPEHFEARLQMRARLGPVENHLAG